jgi:hypothetical protein
MAVMNVMSSFFRDTVQPALPSFIILRQDLLTDIRLPRSVKRSAMMVVAETRIKGRISDEETLGFRHMAYWSGEFPEAWLFTAFYLDWT